ncbi:MAG: efflux RND transporter periplasmic adaptor subunit [Rhodothermales bacterium]|nr:efflux RND transporter periplasmic adaptor subunit [Rhodothermales bacterium]
MDKSTLRWMNVVCASCLLVFALGTSGCGEEAQSKDTQTDETEPAVPVEAAKVVSGEIAAYFSGTASLEAEQEAVVVAKEGGLVARLLAEEGDYVRKGQALAKLDDERLLLDLQRAEVGYLKAEREFKRKEEMHSKQIVSTEEYEVARSEYDTQKANFDLAKLAVDFTTVVAPISGVVSERMIKVGNMVQANAPVFRVTDFSPLLAVMHVPERELNKLKTQQGAIISVDALPGASFTGHVERISPTVDRATGTFKVTVEIRDRTNQLKPGMFGRVTVLYETRSEAMLIPKTAILYEGDDSSVFVIHDSIAVRQSVTVGLSDELSTEILTGVDVGDQVITIGQNNLRDSSRVDVIQ